MTEERRGDKGDGEVVQIALPHCTRHRGQGCPSLSSANTYASLGGYLDEWTNEEQLRRTRAVCRIRRPSAQMERVLQQEEAVKMRLPYLGPIAALYLADVLPCGMAPAARSSKLNSLSSASPSAHWRGRRRPSSATSILHDHTHPAAHPSARAASSPAPPQDHLVILIATTTLGHGQRSSLKESSA